MADHLLTQGELAEILPLTTRQIRTLTGSRVLVTEKLGARQLYPLADNVRRYIEYREGLAKGTKNEVGESKARKLEAEARRAEFEVAALEGSLIPMALHESRLGAVLDRLRARTMAAPGSWAPRLLGAKTVPDMILRLKPLTSSLLEDLASQTDEPNDDEVAA